MTIETVRVLHEMLELLGVLAGEVDSGEGEKGGPGSGNFGHEGRHGEVGGSAPSWSGGAGVLANGLMVYPGKYAASGKWRVLLEDGSPGPARETAEEAVRAFRKLRTEGDEAREQHHLHREIIGRVREGNDDAFSQIAGANISSGRARGILEELGVPSKEAGKMIRRMGIAFESSFGATYRSSTELLQRFRNWQSKSDEKGGPGSGHHGHAGVPGKRGGSAAGTGFTGSVSFGDIGSATARSLHGGNIVVNREHWRDLTPESKHNVIAHEVTHGTVEDFVLKNQGEWDRAERVLTVSTAADGRRLFVGGNMRIGEAVADAVGASLGNDRFGRISDEKWEEIQGWADSVVEGAGYNRDKLVEDIEVAVGELDELNVGEGEKGGPGSGNFGHSGRPGKRGGSSAQGIPGKSMPLSGPSNKTEYFTRGDAEEMVGNKYAWETTQAEFTDHHITGCIQPEGYEHSISAETSWFHTGEQRITEEKAPILLERESLDGLEIEFRQGVNKNKYTYFDRETATHRRDAGGNLIYKPDKEVVAEGLPLWDDTIWAFHDGQAIGHASNEWGTTGIWVIDSYQGHGVGMELLCKIRKYPWLAENKIGQATVAGRGLIEAYHRRLVEEAVGAGRSVPAEVLADYPGLGDKKGLAIKGGAGSGHHGHAGIPGKRGGSSPGTTIDSSYFRDSEGNLTNRARELFDRLDRDGRETLEEALISGNIKDVHLDRLKEVTYDEPEPDWWNDNPNTLGAYDYDTNTAHVRPTGLMNESVLMHELGHHVTLESTWSMSSRGAWARAKIGEAYQQPRPAIGDLPGMGLRKYSFSNMRELAADVWMTSHLGTGEQKANLATFLGVEDLNQIWA